MPMGPGTDYDNGKLYRELMATEYASQLPAILDSGSGDIEPSFLGFVETYKLLAQIIPVGRAVIDLGCAYACQGYYFRHHRVYVGVDPWLETGPHFKVANGRYFAQSINDFIRDHASEYGGVHSFAICNYVPRWHGGYRAIQETFPHLFVFYPEHGDDPAMDSLSKSLLGR